MAAMLLGCLALGMLLLTTAARAADAPAAASQTGADDHGKTEDHGPAKGADGDHGGDGDHGDDHGHNPHDLGHAAASAQLEDPSEYKYDLSIYTFVVFVLLLLILLKFAWGPIVAGLDKREESISGQIDEARRMNEEARAHLKEHEALLAGAAAEVRDLLEQGKRDADQQKQQIIADAQAAAKAEKDRSLAEIRAAKNQALTDLAERSVDTAVSLAGKIVRQKLTPDDHAKLIQEALAEFPSQN